MILLDFEFEFAVVGVFANSCDNHESSSGHEFGAGDEEGAGFFFFPVVGDGNFLLDCIGLSSEGRLVNRDVIAFNEDAINREDLSGRYLNNITNQKIID